MIWSLVKPTRAIKPTRYLLRRETRFNLIFFVGSITSAVEFREVQKLPFQRRLPQPRNAGFWGPPLRRRYSFYDEFHRVSLIITFVNLSVKQPLFLWRVKLAVPRAFRLFRLSPTAFRSWPIEIYAALRKATKKKLPDIRLRDIDRGLFWNRIRGRLLFEVNWHLVTVYQQRTARNVRD